MKSGQTPASTTINPYDLAMLALSILAVSLAGLIIFAPLDTETRHLLIWLDTAICGMFWLNFWINFFRSDQPRRYFRQHWIDLAASIPTIESLRVFRLLQVLRVLRLILVARKVLGPLLKQRIQTSLALAVVILFVVLSFSSVTILLLESDAPGANIRTAADALWWSIVTISTVGYGDLYPVTPQGRLVAGLLIITGVSLFGLISGLIASHFLSEHEEKIEQEEHSIATQLDRQHHDIHQQLANLQQQLDLIQQQLQQLPTAKHPTTSVTRGADN